MINLKDLENIGIEAIKASTPKEHLKKIEDTLYDYFDQKLSLTKNEKVKLNNYQYREVLNSHKNDFNPEEMVKLFFLINTFEIIKK